MSLVERAKNILLQPKQEWQVIDGEPTTVGDLYKSYIIPLSAVPPIAALIGWSVFGFKIPFVGTIRIPIGTLIGRCVLQYVLGLVMVYVLALIIDALAPSFGGSKNQVQALKVAAYSSTASWVVGIFSLIPALSWLGILGLYSLYLMYLGLPVLMKSPTEKALGYTVVVVIAAIVLWIVVGVIVGSVFSFGAMGMGRMP
ncbi:MAG TPA: Yip1 family protein [Gemmatimonadaceae bacterium]|nr:Yip1 family protein [Gemmatimonadaceae bacterium]